MYPKNPSRRNVLKTVAASGALLGTGTMVSGTVAAQSSELPHHVLIFGQSGVRTRYLFTVAGHGTVMKTTDTNGVGIHSDWVTIDSEDRIIETNLWGRPVTVVTGEIAGPRPNADAYWIAGDLDGLTDELDSFWASNTDISVHVNNREQPSLSSEYTRWRGNHVLFQGDGTRGWYGFTVNGSVSKVTYDMGGSADLGTITIDRSDTITYLGDEVLVSGVTKDEADAYTFSGEITWIWADPSVTVSFPSIPNLAVRQTGCDNNNGEISVTNPSDVWVLIRPEGGLRRYIGPHETRKFSSPQDSSWTVEAHLARPNSSLAGTPVLLNGQVGSYTPTVNC